MRWGPRGNRSSVRWGRVLTVALSLVVARHASAQAAALDATLLPDSLVAGPARAAQSYLVVRNNSGGTVHDVRLDWMSDDSVQVAVASDIDASLAPGESVSALVTVARMQGPQRRATVVFRVRYVAASPGAGAASPRVALVTLHIYPDPYAAVDQVAEATLTKAAGTLTEESAGVAYLVLKNKTELPLHVARVTAEGQYLRDSVDIIPTEVPPHGMRSIKLSMVATGKIHPGTQTVVVDVALRWKTPNGEHEGNLIIPAEVELGVAGAAEILTLLGVPTFLFLPGFLMVAVFGLLWRLELLRPKGGTTDFPLKKDDPSFYLVAITLSLATSWLLRGTTSFEVYGTSDVLAVWFKSLLVGGGAYLLYAGGEWATWWWYPAATDDAIMTITRLGRRRMAIELKQITLTAEGAGNPTIMFLLQRRSWLDTPRWLGPQMTVTVMLKEHGATSIPAVERLEKVLATNRMDSVAKLLTEGLGPATYAVAWTSERQRPLQIKLSDTTVQIGDKARVIISDVG